MVPRLAPHPIIGPVSNILISAIVAAVVTLLVEQSGQAFTGGA